MIKSFILLFTLFFSLAHAEEKIEFRSKKIIGVEILVAGAGSGLQSSFGHAFLRLVGEEGDWTKDTVIGFVANPENNESISHFKFFSGFVTGQYPLLMQVSSLYDFWSQYVIREGRSIDRKILLSTPEDRQKLLEKIDEMLNHPEEKMGHYKFLSRNCATLVLELLTQAEFPAPIGGVIKPDSLLEHFDHSWNSPYPQISFSQKKEADELLDKAEVDLKRKDLREENLKKMINNLNELEIKKILVVGEIDGFTRKELVRAFPFSSGASFDQAVGIENLPASVYQYCEDRECAREVYQTILKKQNKRFLKKLITESQLAPNPKTSEINVYSNGEFRKKKMIHIYEDKGHKEIIKIHYQLLKEILTNSLNVSS